MTTEQLNRSNAEKLADHSAFDPTPSSEMPLCEKCGEVCGGDDRGMVIVCEKCFYESKEA